jgi:predicted nucleotidyltransferase
MNATERVAMRLDERRRPVERVVEVLRADERVAAAALTSSYARGETDGLSDLDLG